MVSLDDVSKYDYRANAEDGFGFLLAGLAKENEPIDGEFRFAIV